MIQSNLAPEGTLGLQVFQAPPIRELSWKELKFFAYPRKDQPEEIADWKSDNKKNINRGLDKIKIAEKYGIPTMYGRLWLRKFDREGNVTNYGLASLRVVTTAGVNFIVDAFQNSTELENFKYHALGTGSTAEATGDTALVAELTTEYTGDVRATGTTTEGASANIYRTVATNTLDGTPGAALREHGIFSASTSGTLLDRSVFSAITLSSGESLQSTYDLTFTAGS